MFLPCSTPSETGDEGSLKVHQGEEGDPHRQAKIASNLGKAEKVDLRNFTNKSLL